MPTALVNGVRLNYVLVDEGGDPDREVLVMVHGLATSLAFWYFRYAARLSREFKVLLYDLRGHGRSEMPDSGYRPINHAADLAGLLDHLGIHDAHLVAHSFGGVVSLNFAREHPTRVKSLVLCDTHLSAVRHVKTAQDWAFGQSLQIILDRHGIDLDTQDPYFGYKLLTRVAQWSVNGFTVPDELEELIGPLVGSYLKRSATHWLQLMNNTNAGEEVMGHDGLTLEQLKSFKFPILAMYADNSQARLTGSELLEVWPHAEFRGVRDAGHFFPLSRPEAVLSASLRFWRGEFAPAHKRTRVGEARRSYFRTDRVFQAGGAWYFTTREDDRIGPFAAPEEASDSLVKFLSTRIQLT